MSFKKRFDQIDIGKVGEKRKPSFIEKIIFKRKIELKDEAKEDMRLKSAVKDLELQEEEIRERKRIEGKNIAAKIIADKNKEKKEAAKLLDLRITKVQEKKSEAERKILTGVLIIVAALIFFVLTGKH